MKELFPIPGGGHVLIVPVSHHPTLLSLPPDEAATTLVEVEKCVRLHGRLTENDVFSVDIKNR